MIEGCLLATVQELCTTFFVTQNSEMDITATSLELLQIFKYCSLMQASGIILENMALLALRCFVQHITLKNSVALLQ